jgi:hypothetical protein
VTDAELTEKVMRIMSVVPDQRLATELIISTIRGADREQRRAYDAERKRQQRSVTGRHRTSRDVPGQLVTTSPQVMILDPDPDQIPDPDICAELEPFPTVGSSKEWRATNGLVRELEKAFPGVDVLGELRKARVYFVTYPAKRKTSRGMAKCLFGWISRGVERGTATRKDGHVNGHSRQVPMYRDI